MSSETHPVVVCCGSFAAMCLFVGFILFCCNYKTLGPYRYGLKKNTVTGKVDLTQVFEPGVHNIGFWNDWVTFPSTVQTLQYSFESSEKGVQRLDPLHLRSKDKVPMYLEVSVQYQRKKDELVKLFNKAMTETLQENIYASNIRASLTKIMSEHNSEDCWKHRKNLTAEFFTACQAVMAETHADCWGLQFYRSHMDEKYEKELVQTQVQKQEKRIELAKQKVAMVKAETEVKLAEYAKTITILESTGRAERYNIETLARTNAETRKLEAESTMVVHVKAEFRSAHGASDGSEVMTDSQFVEYQKRLMLGDSLTNSSLFYSLTAASPAHVLVPGGRRLESEVENPGRRLQVRQGGQHTPPPGAEDQNVNEL